MDQTLRTIPADPELDAMQWVADPPADEVVAAILGPWPPHPPTAIAASAKIATADPAIARRLDLVEKLNAVVRSWETNGAVAGWKADEDLIQAGIGLPLEKFVTHAQPLPPWADVPRIERAANLFMEHGALSVTLLFCASLPECYVVPDLAAVLHATGQLEKRVELRIRTTGAMIFPVMMRGGLAQASGSGIAQVLKVRLIHAMVRNLILRRSPEEAAALLRSPGGAAVIPALARIQPDDTMHAVLYVHGWDLANGLPNNQEELAYTLLTFSYVFLRGMRRLGIGFTREEEEDYLHAWNVAGHFLGIRRELMVDTMEEAEALFARMQARGRADWDRRELPDDPRPKLGGALMEAMKSVIPRGPFKAFPVLLTRRMLERESIRDLGLDGHVSWVSRVLFRALLALARGIDAVVRVFFPHFSICRLITRAIGYRMTCALLMSQTCELSVPGRLRPGIKGLIRDWGHDPRAPRWMNAVEDRMTTQGEWHALDRTRCDEGR